MNMKVTTIIEFIFMVLAMIIGFYFGTDFGIEKQKEAQARIECEYKYAVDPMIGVTAECYKFFVK